MEGFQEDLEALILDLNGNEVVKDLTPEEKEKHSDTLEVIKWYCNKMMAEVGSSRQDVHIVKDILDVRLKKGTWELEFKVRWQDDSHTWEPMKNVEGCYYLTQYLQKAEEDSGHKMHGLIPDDE